MAGELLGITGIELIRLVELRVTLRRSVRTHSHQALLPLSLTTQNVLEVRWVRAVDHEVRNRSVRCGVDLFDRLGQRLTAREPAVRLERERDRDGKLRRLCRLRDADR